MNLHQLRIRLAQTEALVPLTLLGLLTGALAAGLIIIFRELVAFISLWILPSEDSGFAGLDSIWRFLLPVAGSLLLIGLIKICPENRRQFGIAYVIERLTFNWGRLPLTSVIGQFFGALLALVSGFSVGLVGPAVHMGAGMGSYLGAKFKLPDNILTALAGCGSAAAISASLNTPIAGVIFAMEVVMKEYALHSFIPVMAASVCAAVISQAMYGSAPVFDIPMIPMISLTELVISAITALLIGVMAASFIKLNLFAARQRRGHIAMPLLVAGLLMGITGLLIPQAMGMGYDSLNIILNGGTLDWSFLIILLLSKILMTAMVTGLGVPGGIIGPSLVIGGIAGTLLGTTGDAASGISVSNVSFHAMVGMVAMMAAILQAPLAGLATVLEMTQNAHIILPAMFAIIIACLTSSQLFGQQGLFDMQFKTRGQQADISPLARQLNQTGVACLMDSHFNRCPRYLNLKDKKALEHPWTLIEENRHITHILSSSDISLLPDSEKETVDLLDNFNVKPLYEISMQATLNDALRLMDQKSVNVLSVQIFDHQHKELCGIITREAIETFYKPSNHEVP